MQTILASRLMRFMWLLAAVALLCVGCGKPGGKDGKGKGKGKGESSEQAAVPVETVIVQKGEVADTVLSTATLASKSEVTVSARAAGQLMALDVEEGDVVEANQVIGRVKNPDLSLGVERAQSQQRRAKSEVDRLKPLLDKGFIPRAEYDRAKTELEIARDEVKRARSGASETRLISPNAGVISVRHLDVGAQLTPNQPVVTIVDTGSLLVELQVPERELGRIALEQPVRIVSEALGDHEFPASITAIAPTVDPMSGTIKVTATLTAIEDTKGRFLRPGMFIEARIVTETRTDVPLVPKRSLLYEETRPYVYVVKDDKAVWSWVETGVADGGNIEITKGVEVGQEVVILGQTALKDDSDVSVNRRDGVDLEPTRPADDDDERAAKESE